MAQTKTREELVRLAWLTELRQHPDRQCRFLSRGSRGRVCALMLLADLTGETPLMQARILGGKTMPVIDYAAIAARAGLNREQAQTVIQFNDYGKNSRKHVGRHPHVRPEPLTFPMIADVVDSWFAGEKHASNVARPLPLRAKGRMRARFLSWWCRVTG